MRLNSDQLRQLDKSFRTNLINASSGFKSANLVGTVSVTGLTNLAVFSSVVHIGAHPPLNAMIFRPDSVARHTLENILATGHYTINHIHDGICIAAHQTSARYPREQSEFAATGLTECRLVDFPAPFVAESRIRLGMRYREHHALAINDTVMVIGEVVLFEAPDDCVESSGHLALDRAGTLAVNGLDGYHQPRQLVRLTYAKPDREPEPL